LLLDRTERLGAALAQSRPDALVSSYSKMRWKIAVSVATNAVNNLFVSISNKASAYGLGHAT
jgi:hypothetical protein